MCPLSWHQDSSRTAWRWSQCLKAKFKGTPHPTPLPYPPTPGGRQQALHAGRPWLLFSILIRCNCVHPSGPVRRSHPDCRTSPPSHPPMGGSKTSSVHAARRSEEHTSEPPSITNL